MMAGRKTNSKKERASQFLPYAKRANASLALFALPDRHRLSLLNTRLAFLIMLL